MRRRWTWRLGLVAGVSGSLVGVGPPLQGAGPPVTREHVATDSAATVGRPSLEKLVSASGATAYWPMTEQAGRVVHDVIAGHDGLATEAVRLGQAGEGPSMTSYGFDGATARVTVPAAGLAPGTVAVALWLRTTGAPPNPRETVVDTGGITVAVRDGRVVVTTCGTRVRCSRLVSRAHVSDGAWHQVVAGVATGTVTLYVDGARDGAAASPGVRARPHDAVVSIGEGFRGNLNDVALFEQPVTSSAVTAQFRAGACPQAAGTLPVGVSTRRYLPALPLHTAGRFVVDRLGRRVKFAGVNWYGAEELDRVPAGLQCRSADAIAARIAADGFNVVRLPWATNTWVGRPPSVPAVAVAGDPRLRGLDARAVFDAVVAALARHGLMVVLDNHVTRPAWCCSGRDGNALWWQGYSPAHPPPWARMTRRHRLAYFTAGQSRWLSAWAAIVARYAPGGRQPTSAVVGVDLRNEPRSDTTLDIPVAWAAGTPPVWSDWARAATRAGNLVLRTNPHMLVGVEGVGYATDLRAVAARPVRLRVAHRLVYSVHDYAFSQPGMPPARLRRHLDARWGWLLAGHRQSTAPVWVGEFGTWQPELPWRSTADQRWWSAFTRYLRRHNVGWTYWSINGTFARSADDQASCASSHSPGCAEGYGLSDRSWAGNSSLRLLARLRELQPATPNPPRLRVRRAR